MSEFKELFEASLRESGAASSGAYAGAEVEAKVVAIERDYVILTAGLKSECEVSIHEFTNKDGVVDVNIGDIVTAVLVSIDDGYGRTELSREKAKRNEAWKRIEKVYDTKETILGRILDRVKGGFTVDIGDIRAFLPGSLVDTRPIRDTTHLEGKDLEFKVIKMDQKRNNIVVSRRAVVEAEGSVERDNLLENLEEGAELIGVVKNLTDYGAFVDLGGVDGLLHITDLSWRRVKHPSEVLTVGQELKVKVLKFDRERSRVSLGIKQLAEDPWGDIAARYPVGTQLKGKVTNITDYGCFVEIEEGVEGLVHMSEMDWTNKNVHPNRVVQLGEEVEVKVLEIEEDRRRISLGMKQCISNPWDAFAAIHNKGDKVSGSIRSITDFGIFIGLDGAIDGLIHLSDISWREPGEEAVKAYKKGQEIEAVILAIDPERERISLSIKQLEEEPEDAAKAYTKGSIVKGKVIEVDAKAATIQLPDGTSAVLRASEISEAKVDDARTALSVGDEVEAKIINIDKKTRLVQISIKAKDADEHAEAMKKYTKSSDDISNTTLGDLLKAQIDTNRSE